MVTSGLKAARTRSRVEISSVMPSRAKYSACMGTMRVSAAHQDVEGEQVECRRAIEDDQVEAGLDGAECVAQAEGAVAGCGQLDVGAGKVLGAGQQGEGLDLGGQNDLLGGRVAHEDVIDGMAVVIALEAEAGGAVGLGVAVDKEDFEAFESEAGSKVDGSGGFANSALLVDNAENLTHGRSRVKGRAD